MIGLWDMIDVTAAILVKDGKVLIAKRKPDDQQPDKWEFPGGKIEAGESARRCLKREMREEFGIDVRVGKFLGESIYDYPHASIRLLAYLAEWQAGNLALKDHADFAWAQCDRLDEFDFAPADLPFVRKLVSGQVKI
jgi:8-oxo-dGTP diphosphatase